MIIDDNLNEVWENGEYFFRFLKKKNAERIKYDFVINKDCSDYERLISFGNILIFGSEDYLNIFLKADKIISSVYKSWVDNPFGNDQKYIRDLFHFDYIYIKNGILKVDLSESMDKINKNLDIIITSAKKEYEYILDERFEYKKDNILLTGLPRYDSLQKLQPLIKKKSYLFLEH